MGLKSKLSKMKNFLFDDEDEDTVAVKKNKDKKENKKENKKEVAETPKVSNDNSFDEDFYLEDLSDGLESTTQVKSRTNKPDLDFKFPEFDDSDFMVSKPITKHEEIIPSYEVEKPKLNPKPQNLYQGTRRKDEIKKFKPSPIISPIYGLLDKDGNMVEKGSLDYKKVVEEKEEVTFDDVRKKAYGNLDEEIENTIKRLNKKTIEEAEREMEEEEKKLKREKKEQVKKAKAIKSEIEDDDDDDMILPNINFKEIDVDNKKIISKSSKNKDDDDDDEDTKEQDLFNLIDTIYAGKEKDK